MSLNYLSVCSGIEAATAAWHPLGWRAAAFSEIEKFPCAVLAHHYPDVPNLGDMTRFQEWPDAAIDVLVGGTPCQSFSVAGLRKGLADPRGNLMLTYLAIAARYRPEWLVWENVPGVLSSNGGRDFGALLGGLAELGYGFAYRILDAQHFGVPQRRRRVFVVGCLGNWRRAAAVLFERHSLQGNPAPRRKAREGITARTAYGVSPGCPHRAGEGAGGTAGERSGLGIDLETAYALRAKRPGGVAQAFGGSNTAGPIEVATAVNACASASGRMDFESETFVAHTPVAFDCKAGGNTFFAIGDKAGALRGEGHGGGHAAVAFAQNQRDEVRVLSVTGATSSIRRGDAKNETLIAASAVRRLTPRECERLQGFPDDYTLIHVRGKPAADGPRYKALGNSMAVPCMAWLGHRIQSVGVLA